MTIDIHSSVSLTSDVPDVPTLFLVQGRYQNWIKPIIILEYLKIRWQPVVLSDPDSGTAWYGTIHPYKYLPALIENVDGERVVLWDSSAILHHLGQRYDHTKELVGRTAQEDIEIMNWLTFETASLGPTAKYWVWYDMRTGEDLNPKAWEKMMSDLKRQYSIMNKRLEETGQKWMALKDRPTIADIAVYPFADNHTLKRMKLDVSQWPALEDWTRRMSELDYVRKAYDEMASRSVVPIA